MKKAICICIVVYMVLFSGWHSVYAQSELPQPSIQLQDQPFTDEGSILSDKDVDPEDEFRGRYWEEHEPFEIEIKNFRQREYIPPSEKIIRMTNEMVNRFDCNTVVPLGYLQSECEALVALYQDTNGAGWKNKTNWLSTPALSTWFGVVVSQADPNTIVVDQVRLIDNNLNGFLPEQLGNFTSLRRLILYDNQLTGEIPASLGNLSTLNDLFLSRNRLVGQIPAELGNLTNLTSLYLSSNRFTGEIPIELGNLSNMTYFVLSTNQLTGEIPGELGNLSNLTHLYLYDNQLTGEIPNNLQNLSSLIYLYLSSNQFTGVIPAWLGSLSNLVGLSISGDLTGEIPDTLSNLVNLTRLSLQANLTGEIPTWLENLTSLTQLHLSCNLTGEVPVWLGTLTNLTHLNLGHNQLSGVIPAELGTLPNLTHLYLSYNQLTGTIPVALSNLSNLAQLFLQYNQITGEVPVWLGTLTNLTQLNLDHNQLSGVIPAELGNLPNLTHLYLSHNQLTGTIPVALSNLSNLAQLFLQYNQITGEVPVWLGTLTNLTQLNLDHNQLSGVIPAELGNLPNLTHLYLSHNQLTGTIPVALSNLSNLAQLFLQYNKITGEIPVWLGTLTNLTQLNLDHNQLSGVIPAELGNLPNLTHLYLSYNQLTGTIPAELGNLSDLYLLDLQENQLVGEIPAEIGNLLQLEWLYLFHNQLTGTIPEEIGNLLELKVFGIWRNQIEGEISESFTNLTKLVSTEVSYNYLNVPQANPAVQEFLNQKNPNWDKKQRVIPSAEDDNYEVRKDNLLTVSAPGVLGNDAYTLNNYYPTVTLLKESDTTHGQIELGTDGSFVYTPDPGYSGEDSFTYKFFEGQKYSSVGTVTINVLNAVPIAEDLTITTDEDIAVAITLVGTDADDDALTYTVLTTPTNGSLTGTAPNLTYTPAPNYLGEDSFTYKVNDGTVDSNIATVTIIVALINDPPVLDPIENANIPEMVEYNFTATATDVDSINLIFSLVNAPTGATIDALTGVFTWTPTEDQGPENHSFKVKVCDDGTPLLCDDQDLTLIVEEVNLPPALNPIGDKEVYANKILTFTAVANDPDIPDQPLIFRLDLAPEGASIHASTGVFTWIPSEEQVGTHNVNVCVSDGISENCEMISVIVKEPLLENHPPVAVEDAYEMMETMALEVRAPGVLANDTDEDGDSLIAILVETTESGTLVLNTDGSFSYTPNLGFRGIDTFTYKAYDGEAESNIVTVTITVKEGPPEPEIKLFFPVIQKQ